MRRFAAMIGLALLLVRPASAETLEARFGVRLFGLPVGQMVVATNEAHNAYAARGEFRTTGLVGFLAKVQFSMSARGVGQIPALSSRSYREDLNTGYRSSEVALSFASEDRRIDPLSAMLAAMLDRPRNMGCQMDRQTFDGARSMRLQLWVAHEQDGALVCDGTLTRLSGYDAETMARGTRFGIHAEYRIEVGQLKLTRADVETEHGKVALVRQD